MIKLKIGQFESTITSRQIIYGSAATYQLFEYISKKHKISLENFDYVTKTLTPVGVRILRTPSAFRTGHVICVYVFPKKTTFCTL